MPQSHKVVRDLKGGHSLWLGAGKGPHAGVLDVGVGPFAGLGEVGHEEQGVPGRRQLGQRQGHTMNEHGMSWKGIDAQVGWINRAIISHYGREAQVSLGKGGIYACDSTCPFPLSSACPYQS